MNLISSGWARRWLGASTVTRARQLASTLGAMPANSRPGSPIAVIEASFATSALAVFKLTLPGSDLMAAKTSRPSAPSPASAPGSSLAAEISSTIRFWTSGGTWPLISAMRVSSARCSAEPMIRPIRVPAGGSIFSHRHCPSSSSRTRSARCSLQHTCPASHAVRFSASATLHSRNPVTRRISARCRLTCRPSQSYKPISAAGTPTCPATNSTMLSGSSPRPRGNRAFHSRNFRLRLNPSRVAPLLFRSSRISSGYSVKCSTSSSSSKGCATPGSFTADGSGPPPDSP